MKTREQCRQLENNDRLLLKDNPIKVLTDVFCYFINLFKHGGYGVYIHTKIVFRVGSQWHYPNSRWLSHGSIWGCTLKMRPQFPISKDFSSAHTEWGYNWTWLIQLRIPDRVDTGHQWALPNTWLNIQTLIQWVYSSWILVLKTWHSSAKTSNSLAGILKTKGTNFYLA